MRAYMHTRAFVCACVYEKTKHIASKVRGNVNYDFHKIIQLICYIPDFINQITDIGKHRNFCLSETLRYE